MLEYDNINHRIAKVTNSKPLLNYLTANQSFKFTLYQDFQTCKKIFSMSGDWAQSWTDYGAAYLGVNYDSRLHTFYLLFVYLQLKKNLLKEIRNIDREPILPNFINTYFSKRFWFRKRFQNAGSSILVKLFLKKDICNCRRPKNKLMQTDEWIRDNDLFWWAPNFTRVLIPALLPQMQSWKIKIL